MPRVIKIVKSLTWREYLARFLAEKRLNGCRETTINDYRYYIPRFFEGLTLEDWEGIQKRVNEYFSSDLAPATFNIRRAYLKAFFNYLVQQGAVPQNPITFKKRKTESKMRAVPPEILQKLLRLPDKNTFAGLRNYTLLLLTLDTGIRPKEALSLLPEHFNLEAREVTIPGGIAKTKAPRTLPLSSLTVQWLHRLLSVRHSAWHNAPVFCTWEGKPMQRNSWTKILQDYSKKLGYRITPYDLHHAFALYSLRNGMNVFVLQRILGHTDLTMTKRYLALTQEDLQKEHEKSSPLNVLGAKRIRKIS
ncbi:MAG: integrase/recombinase XerD [Candidatus Atribacteria bacterium]|jgi:site-specific recombinase XerD|uniref:Tyrosine-type recombinase/integrase n=1 Tax=Thermatribacter velox TaxID=3039681 RepID=A0ABZ2YG16_9BACT|nr:integrase/recombinase XerD [Candidatus Atribacteria bacterium]